jgi:hypothetical protein
MSRVYILSVGHMTHTNPIRSGYLRLVKPFGQTWLIRRKYDCSISSRRFVSTISRSQDKSYSLFITIAITSLFVERLLRRRFASVFNINCIREFSIIRKSRCEIAFERNCSFVVLYKEIKELQSCNMFVKSRKSCSFNCECCAFLVAIASFES